MITLPAPFVSRMQSLLGDDYAAFHEALTAGEQPVSIRLNSHKGAVCDSCKTPVPWSGGVGIYLDERPAFTFDPLLHAGAYYVQEAASMFLARVIEQLIHDPVKYLDMCAAPGGKSTLALSLLPQGSLVVANEYVRARASILTENIIKWGSPATVVTNNSARDWSQYTHYFDVIATDVPCSGEGMFRKDPEAVAAWSPAAVNACVARQREILDNIWEALRPGGLLIYSTCTYNTAEDEEMVAYLVDKYDASPLTVDVDPAWGITGALQGELPVYRFMPHRTCGEGLFMAVLRKPHGPSVARPLDRAAHKKGRADKNNKSAFLPGDVMQWVHCSNDYSWTIDRTGAVVALPVRYAADIKDFDARLRVLHMGLPVAALKGRDYVPTHALALSTALCTRAFPSCDVDYDTAIAYLHREAITLPAHVPAGYVLITYRGFALGWVKNLGARANNLYPQEWRIRATQPLAQSRHAGVSHRDYRPE